MFIFISEMQPTFGEAKVRISEKKTKFFIMFFFKTTSFLGESGLQTMRLNVTFTPFVTFKLRKLFVHLRKNTYPPTYMCLKPLSTGHLWIGTCLFNRYLTPT